MWPLFKKKDPVKKGKVALCLNSSFFGFYAHSGFLYELYNMGIVPAQVSGASAGAIIAGLYAAGLEPDYIIRMILRRQLKWAFWELSLPKKLIRMIFNIPGATGLLSGQRFIRLLEKEIGKMQIENCPTAGLYISVANMTKNRQELKSSGPLAQTILASCCVPGMFEAHSIANNIYWDGGIADPVPIEQWVDDPQIDTILVHQTLNHKPPHSDSKRPGLWQGLHNASQIANDEIIRMKLKMAQMSGKKIILLKTLTPMSGPTRMHLGPRNIQEGRNTVRRNFRVLADLL